jgi:hypothetical protein
METTMKQTRTILALFIAVFALPMAAIGQDEQASNDEAIEDIVVVGQKSMGGRKSRFGSENGQVSGEAGNIDCLRSGIAGRADPL